MNEEVIPCPELVMDAGPKPPPPPAGSLIKTDSLKSHEDLYPPSLPTAEVNLGSYNTHPALDHVHMQESYTYSELDSLKKENEALKTKVSKLDALVKRLQAENKRVVNENTYLTLMKPDLQNGMPIPEQNTSAGFRKQSEMVPKGSGTC